MEIMVAMAILAIAITVLIEVFSGALRLAGKSQEYSRAVFYGRQLIEELSLRENIAEQSEEGVFEGDYTWRYEIALNDILIGEDDENVNADFTLMVYTISVTVLWPSGAAQKKLTFETLKTVVEPKEDGGTNPKRL